MDTQGRGLVVADSENQRIRLVTMEGAVSTLAGGGGAGPPIVGRVRHTDGPVAEATLVEMACARHLRIGGLNHSLLK